MRRFLIKTFKIVSYILIGLLVVLLVLMNIFLRPKSDANIREIFSEGNTTLQLSTEQFENESFRVISTRKEVDTTLPNILFIHGSPGSAMDFKRYLLDEDLNSKANLISFDRIGYGESNAGDIRKILFEASMVNALTSEMDISKTILVGYSYGGPIALASKKNYKKIILCAPAVYSDVEPMFWMLNFYRWKATRWIMPDMLKAASKEKLQHPSDLRLLEQYWGENNSDIHVIHGDKDWIVPFGNSLFIKDQFPKERFELITLKGAGHDLIWSRYEEVKRELLKVIEE